MTDRAIVIGAGIGGLDILEHWFPGITDERLTRGASAIDNGSEMRWYHHGVWKLRQPSGLTIPSQSRPLLEHADSSSLLHYARGLDQPDLAHALENAVPVGPVRQIHYREQLRRDFRSLHRFPAGYLSIGDMVCSLNPVDGQGVAVCAKESLVLSACLEKTNPTSPGGDFARCYFRAIEPIVSGAWLLASANDFLYP